MMFINKTENRYLSLIVLHFKGMSNKNFKSLYFGDTYDFIRWNRLYKKQYSPSSYK